MRMWLALVATLLVNAAYAQTQEARPQRELLRPPSAREVASPISDRFALRITYFAPGADTFLRLDRRTGQQGTELFAEDDLALEDKPTQARAEMTFRFGERNKLRVDYFKLTRYGDKVLDRTIAFGDQTFLVNDRAQTMIDYRQLTLTYTRSVLYFDRFEFGLGLGVSLLEARAKGEVTARNIREQQDGVIPFPTVAADIGWRISKRWSLTLRGQTFTANTEDADGSLTDYHADIQYRWRKNFALGLGYTTLRIDAETTSIDDLSGRFDQDISGPEFFIRASF